MEVLTISSKDPQINEEIKNKELRVVADDGEQLGIMSSEEAQAKADELEKDLVMIAPTAEPPVAKIMDYGKYRYELSRKEKEARKNQKTVELKELRLSVNIAEHDFNTRVKKAIDFLQHGNKVKISIRFKGREMAHRELAYGPMEEFAKAVEEYSVIETKPKMEGRSMFMLLAPKND